MPVRGDKVIDLVKAGIVDGGENAFGITTGAGADVPGINQKRLAGRGDHEHRLATFDIHDVDLQAFWRR
jgi:hypothetical protein